MRKKITRRKFLKSVGTVGGAAVFGGFNISNHSFAQAKEPIKVGCIIPLTGPFGTEAKDQEAGVTLAVEELNAKGGVLGRKVELLVRDDKLKPDESARRAKELIEKDQVHLMIGSLGAHTQLAINEQCKLAKTIFMSISKSNELTVAKDVTLIPLLKRLIPISSLRLWDHGFSRIWERSGSSWPLTIPLDGN